MVVNASRLLRTLLASEPGDESRQDQAASGVARDTRGSCLRCTLAGEFASRGWPAGAWQIGEKMSEELAEKSKRHSAFFYMDVESCIDHVDAEAEQYSDRENFIRAVISGLEKLTK